MEAKKDDKVVPKKEEIAPKDVKPEAKKEDKKKKEKKAEKKVEKPEKEDKKVVKKPVEKKEEEKKATFSVDCSVPVNDKVFKADELLQYFRKRIKVHGRIPTPKESPVTLSKEDEKVIKVQAPMPFAKRYIKYLTKKFLKKHEIRDYLHVVANGKLSYQVKYFKIENEEA